MNAAPRILLVDDDREILEMTSLLLAGAGYGVEPAPSGEEALFRLHQQSFDLVLLDINMPRMDGWEVLRLLKEDEATRDVPVIMFSVNFELREKLHALQQGAVDYITKPFDTRTLVERIAGVLPAAAKGSE
ncbi:MAG: response regulator [Acidobacteriota bacterium]|nr:response regulator [Acidobacteriota bacterium]MDQ7088866.1 response regulator [Acidobacteriota bacterium]